ncbi:hypothetical protein [Oscillatoria sp. FACHB-1406]|uniref:hypothetical protein n=1 Tax=Oscillatoria sp. FACHB-1406 TaxID=2692846 RepID=UPI0016863293|nr:hypothetical protein [Oscillatoria sp. FACHB-1406]MBD2578636.1 hypothetical protein [Oscillatoria sp. FACHB-1406]
MDITEQLLENTSGASDLWLLSSGDLLSYEEEIANKFNYTDSNESALEWATSEIKNQLSGFVRAGMIAARVKRLHLHLKAGFLSFKDWCDKALKKTHWYVNKLIDAAEIVTTLLHAGFDVLPTCEAQCRPLVKLFDKKTGSADELIEAWHEITETIPAQHITTNRINEYLGELKPPAKQRISLPKELYEKLDRQAQSKGLTVEELLESFAEEEEPSEVEPEKQEEWQKDVQALVQQQDLVEAIEHEMTLLEPRKTSERVKVAWSVLNRLRCQMFNAVGTS